MIFCMLSRTPSPSGKGFTLNLRIKILPKQVPYWQGMQIYMSSLTSVSILLRVTLRRRFGMIPLWRTPESSVNGNKSFLYLYRCSITSVTQHINLQVLSHPIRLCTISSIFNFNVFKTVQSLEDNFWAVPNVVLHTGTKSVENDRNNNLNLLINDAIRTATAWGKFC